MKIMKTKKYIIIICFETEKLNYVLKEIDYNELIKFISISFYKF